MRVCVGIGVSPSMIVGEVLESLWTCLARVKLL